MDSEVQRLERRLQEWNLQSERNRDQRNAKQGFIEQKREEIASRDAAQYERWQRDPERFVYPGGECRQTFHRRVAAGLADVLAEPAGGNRLLVVHRGVIAVILAELLHLSAAERRAVGIDLGSIHVLVRDARGWRAEVLNRVDHLRGVGEREELSA